MSLRLNIIPIVLLPFIGLVSGCQHSNNTGNSVPSIDPTLPGVSSGWVIGHKEKKSFGFISNYCVVDTLNVTDTFRDEKGSLISPGDSAGRISGYSFVINREYSRMHGSLFVGEENDSLQVRAVLHHRHTGIGDTISPIPLRSEDYTLYGRTFKDCIVIDSLNSCYSGQPAEGVRNKITTYVFSKEFGLIYYRFEDGEEFHRWDL